MRAYHASTAQGISSFLFALLHENLNYPNAKKNGMTTIKKFSYIRDGVKKSKWKFKMAFAMKGGGSRGVSSATYLFWKMIFVKNHLESFPDC